MNVWQIETKPNKIKNHINLSKWRHIWSLLVRLMHKTTCEQGSPAGIWVTPQKPPFPNALGTGRWREVIQTGGAWKIPLFLTRIHMCVCVHINIILFKIKTNVCLFTNFLKKGQGLFSEYCLLIRVLFFKKNVMCSVEFPILVHLKQNKKLQTPVAQCESRILLDFNAFFPSIFYKGLVHI